MLYMNTGLTALRLTTGDPRQWVAEVWNGRNAGAMRLDGTEVRVVSLRGTLDCPEPAAELARVFAWLDGYGVAPGSISGMAWALWRRTLADEVELSTDPAQGRGGLYGGRKGLSEVVKGPGKYRHMVHVDLTAAYPSEMAARPYALKLTEVSPSSTLDPTVAGLAEATVMVPGDIAYPPLPRRVGPDVIDFPRGSVHGIWPWAELAGVRADGFAVIVRRAWAPAAEADLFGGEWWALVQSGRALGGGAGRLAKAIANSTWGLFALNGENAKEVRWRDVDSSYTSRVTPPRKIAQYRTAHVAAETTGRVRARLWRDALCGDGPGPIAFDTDGYIQRRSAPLPPNAGDGAGEWRVKIDMAWCEIAASQVYRYGCRALCPTCVGGDAHYVASGMGPEAARWHFDNRRGGIGLTFGILGPGDLTVPGRNTLEQELTRVDVRDVYATREHAFGAALGGSLV
jgi:hypothetical protein